MCVNRPKSGDEDDGNRARDKVKEAEKMVKKAKDLTTLTFTRWGKDWTNATPLFEQAALTFKLAKDSQAAKNAFVQAAIGHMKQSAPWTAGKHMEAAGALAKELGSWDEVVDLFKHASKLYVECGKAQPGADALTKGARAVEEAKPQEALNMYMDACRLLEEDNREQMAFDIYRAATNVNIKLNKFEEAASVLLRWGLAADKSKAVQSQCKAYLSAIIVYLYAEQYREALLCYNDCSTMDVFFKSEQNQCAEQLLAAYREGSSHEIQRVISTSKIIPHLDHMIIRLAKQLPRGKLITEVSADELM